MNKNNNSNNTIETSSAPVEKVDESVDISIDGSHDAISDIVATKTKVSEQVRNKTSSGGVTSKKSASNKNIQKKRAKRDVGNMSQTQLKHIVSKMIHKEIEELLIENKKYSSGKHFNARKIAQNTSKIRSLRSMLVDLVKATINMIQEMYHNLWKV